MHVLMKVLHSDIFVCLTCMWFIQKEHNITVIISMLTVYNNYVVLEGICNYSRVLVLIEVFSLSNHS